jgi:hypothetical protein
MWVDGATPLEYILDMLTFDSSDSIQRRPMYIFGIVKYPEKNISYIVMRTEQKNRNAFLFASRQHLPYDIHQRPILQSCSNSFFVCQLFIHRLVGAMRALLDTHIEPKPRG